MLCHDLSREEKEVLSRVNAWNACLPTCLSWREKETFWKIGMENGIGFSWLCKYVCVYYVCVLVLHDFSLSLRPSLFIVLEHSRHLD